MDEKDYQDCIDEMVEKNADLTERLANANNEVLRLKIEIERAAQEPGYWKVRYRNARKDMEEYRALCDSQLHEIYLLKIKLADALKNG